MDPTATILAEFLRSGPFAVVLAAAAVGWISFKPSVDALRQQIVDLREEHAEREAKTAAACAKREAEKDKIIETYRRTLMELARKKVAG